MRKLMTFKVRMVVVAALAAATLGLSSLVAAPSASAERISCFNANQLARAAWNHARLFELTGHPELAAYWRGQAERYLEWYCGGYYD